MPKKHHNKQTRPHRRSHAAVAPAPFLHKETVTLSDVINISGTSILGDGRAVV